MLDFVWMVIAFLLGYMARKYVEKRWPAQSKMVDATAKAKADEVMNASKSSLGPKE